MTEEKRTQTDARTLTIIEPKRDDGDYPDYPVYRQYPGQSEPQPAHIELDCRTGEICAEYNAEVGNAVPAAKWHGHLLWWGIPRYLTCDDILALMDEIAPLILQLYSAYESEWDGSNHVARFGLADDEYEDIYSQIERICANWETYTNEPFPWETED